MSREEKNCQAFTVNTLCFWKRCQKFNCEVQVSLSCARQNQSAVMNGLHTSPAKRESEKARDAQDFLSPCTAEGTGEAF